MTCHFVWRDEITDSYPRWNIDKTKLAIKILISDPESRGNLAPGTYKNDFLDQFLAYLFCASNITKKSRIKKLWHRILWGTIIKDNDYWWTIGKTNLAIKNLISELESRGNLPPGTYKNILYITFWCLYFAPWKSQNNSMCWKLDMSHFMRDDNQRQWLPIRYWQN